MSISVMDALVIQNRDVRCEAGGPDKDGKWAGWIMIDEDRWSPVLNTQPIFESKEAAIKCMENLVSEVRKTKVPNPLDSLPKDEKETIEDIVRMSKEGP